MTSLLALMVVAVALAGMSIPAFAEDPAVVCNVKVLSDKVKDVSSLEAWKKSYLDGLKTDADKAKACWESVVTYQHQETPPNEFLQLEGNVLDPIKLFNVYGYSLCSVAAAEVSQLARVAGLRPRGWTINCHCIMEIEHDGGWHMYDASLINYFPKADGKLASVKEICDAVRAWLKDHPDVCKPGTQFGDDAKLRAYGWADGKTAWKKLGPDLTSRCPFYNERGWWPAGTHGWYSTMQEYDGTGNTPFIWESASTMGYQVNIQLRPGEKLVRNWSNKGLHINMNKDDGGTPGCLNGTTGKDALQYTPKYGDLAPGRVGNGRLEYEPPMASLPAVALQCDNLALDGGSLRVKDAGKSGVLVLRMPSSYVYLNGEMKASMAVGSKGSYKVSFSDNNGLDWKELAKGVANWDDTIKLPVLRRYDYRLRFEFQGEGTGLSSLKIGHDIQHSQRPLPALDKGDNTITFSAGPQESTMAVEGSLGAKGKGLTAADFKPQIDGLDSKFAVTGPTGSITFPIEAPGPITAIRAGTFFQAWSPEDGFEVQASFDGGKTFKTLQKSDKSERFNYVRGETKDVPASTKSAMVRFVGTKKGTLMMQTFHVNVDFKPPGAGFRPVKVTYVWTEDGKEMKDEHVAKTANETYKIKCESKPVMKSITMELAE